MNERAQMKVEEFDKVVAEIRATLVSKNNDYGDDNIGTFGEKGIVVRMWDKMSRLKTLIWHAQEQLVLNEKLEDTLKDLANYAIICIIYMRGKWK